MRNKDLIREKCMPKSRLAGKKGEPWTTNPLYI